MRPASLIDPDIGRQRHRWFETPRRADLGRPGTSPGTCVQDNPDAMDFPRIVIGYHGCLDPVASQLLSGDLPIRDWPRSENAWDWLGRGVYFWEHAPSRALAWARAKAERAGRSGSEAVVGALIRLGNCFDLLDVSYSAAPAAAYNDLRATYAAAGRHLPSNRGSDADLRRRELDCLVINYCLDLSPVTYDSVRAAFIEGPPAYPGAKIHRETHIQIAVRNPGCILGVFRPNL